MSNSAVANRYALALFQLAKEQKLLDQLEDELRVVREVIKPKYRLQSSFTKIIQSYQKMKKRQLIKNVFSSC